MSHHNPSFSNFASFLTSSSLSTVLGVALGGASGNYLYGGIAGLTLNIADEYFDSYDILDNSHLLSRGAFWGTSLFYSYKHLQQWFPTQLAAPTLPIVASIAVVGTLASYFTDDFLNFENKVTTPLVAFNTVNQLFDTDHTFTKEAWADIPAKFLESPITAFEQISHNLHSAYENPFFNCFVQFSLLNIAEKLVDAYALKYIGSYVNSMFIRTLLNKTDGTYDFQSIFKEGGKILGLFALKQIIDLVIANYKNDISRQTLEIVNEKGTELILQGNNGRKVIAAENGSVVLQNVNYDLYTLVNNGVNKLSTVFADNINFSNSCYQIFGTRPDIISYYLISQIPYQLFLSKTSKQAQIMAEEASVLENKVWDMKSEISNNIEQINIRDGEDYVSYKYNNLLNQRNNLLKDIEFLDKEKLFWTEIKDTFDKLIDLAYYGYDFSLHMAGKNADIAAIIDKNNYIETLFEIKNYHRTIIEFLNSNLNFQIDNKELLVASERINRFFELIYENDHSQIVRSTNKENKILFEDYNIYINGERLLTLDGLELELGKNYAITGKSGCGKSSTLIDMKEGITGSLTSHGEISFPYNKDKLAKMMFIDQKFYLPNESTLLEAIYFPKLINQLNDQDANLVRNIITYLFKELEIDGFSDDPNGDKGLLTKLDSKDYKKLSGGQAKKVAIIQAILTQPDILILDETFTGLDQRSLIKIEQAINYYLPNCMILSVDHHASDNNFNGFYDYNLHFANNTAQINEIASKDESFIGNNYNYDLSFIKDYGYNNLIDALGAL